MQFEYYVLNYDFNKQEVIPFNIFRNIRVQECTEKEIKKYLRSPKNYKSRNRRTDEAIYGWEALCEEIRSIVMWQEWSRCEYEMGVCGKFEEDISNVRGTDCYEQFLPNCEMVVRECIYQYKKQLKEKK